MSRISTTALDKVTGNTVLIVSGWDEPLKYYHLTIYEFNAGSSSETIYDENCLLFDCLDIKDVFNIFKDLNKVKEKVKELQLTNIQEKFWTEVSIKRGNFDLTISE